MVGILITGIGDGRCQECLSLWECWTHKYTHLDMESDGYVHRASVDLQFQIWKVCHYRTFICICGSMPVNKKKKQTTRSSMAFIVLVSLCCRYPIVLDSVPTAL